MPTISKSADLDRKVKAYMIANIDFTGYTFEDEVSKMPIKDRLRLLEAEFKTATAYERLRINKINALINWLQGLPGCLTIAFENYHIIKLAKEWGSIPEDASEAMEDAILENYWNFMANKLDQLFRGYRMPRMDYLKEQGVV